MMLATVEVRWFFPGEPGDDLLAWFHGSTDACEPAARVDEYLVLPGSETTGVKLREGLFEIKAQTEPPTVARYPNGVEGWRAGWIKWSRFVGDRGRRAALAGTDDRWISVRKERWLRCFSFDDVGRKVPPREIDCADGVPCSGCGVELTRVRVAAPQPEWWTIALEAFADVGEAGVCLDRTAEAVFGSDAPPLELGVSESMSYPSWLATVT